MTEPVLNYNMLTERREKLLLSLTPFAAAFLAKSIYLSGAHDNKSALSSFFSLWSEQSITPTLFLFWKDLNLQEIFNHSGEAGMLMRSVNYHKRKVIMLGIVIKVLIPNIITALPLSPFLDC